MRLYIYLACLLPTVAFLSIPAPLAPPRRISTSYRRTNVMAGAVPAAPLMTAEAAVDAAFDNLHVAGSIFPAIAKRLSGTEISIWSLMLQVQHHGSQPLEFKKNHFLF